MTQELKDLVCRTIHKVLQRSSGNDLIALAEKIGDAVELVIDIKTEESGIASVPEGLSGGPAWNIQQNSPAADPLKEKRYITPPPPAQGAVVPTPQKRVVIMPGDAEFQAPPDATEKSTSGPKIITATVDTRRRARLKPGANLAETQYWSYEDLSAAIDKNTPAEVEFTTQGPDGPITLKANKNVQCQIGMGNVRLTYKHPQAAEDRGDITVGLTAQHPFSLYDEKFDIESAMESIREQLVGLYRYRGGTLEPSAGPEPGPLRLDMKNQPGDRYEARFEPGSPMVSDPLSAVRKQVADSNRALTPRPR